MIGNYSLTCQPIDYSYSPEVPFFIEYFIEQNKRPKFALFFGKKCFYRISPFRIFGRLYKFGIYLWWRRVYNANNVNTAWYLRNPFSGGVEVAVTSSHRRIYCYKWFHSAANCNKKFEHPCTIFFHEKEKHKHPFLPLTISQIIFIPGKISSWRGAQVEGAQAWEFWARFFYTEWSINNF